MGLDILGMTQRNDRFCLVTMNCHLSVMYTLLSNGVDPNLAKNDGTTPLMIASLNGHDDVVQLLLERNVPTNIQIEEGITTFFVPMVI